MGRELDCASGVVYLHSICGAKDAWYAVDLESLGESKKQLSPIAEFTLEMGAGWTVVGEHIYCTGGIRRPAPYQFYVSRELYKFNTGIPNSDWQIESALRKRPRYRPFVFAIKRKIYVLGGQSYPVDYKDDASAKVKKSVDDWTHWGEVYDLDTKTWDALAPDWEEHRFFAGGAAALMGETVVFYSFTDASLLFFDTATQKFRYEKHPSLSLRRNCLPEVLKGCTKYLPTLKLITANMQPLIKDSTLYWFSHDLCLYGYDFVNWAWLRSATLEGTSWSLPLEPGTIIGNPILLDLGNGNFLVIVRLKEQLLGMASLAVSKGVDSLHVSLQCSCTIPVDRSFIPLTGMAVLNAGPISMLGKRVSAVEE